ncbi:MAG: malate synthase G, partial [Pseudomonadota bacterium]
MSDRIAKGGLRIAPELHAFIEDEVLAGTGLAPSEFWSGFDRALAKLAPRNRALLAERDRLQEAIDTWHREHPSRPIDQAAYRAFLTEIGYLVPDVGDVDVTTENVDQEITTIAGPQLVVPIMNARYALNAANARWGSLYDALYGTDAIPDDDGAERGAGYNPKRGEKVIAWARDFLDRSVPLAGASWSDVTGLRVGDAGLEVAAGAKVDIGLADTDAFVGYEGDRAAPSTVVLVNNGLHIEIVIDPASEIGRTDAADISDVRLESALTTIMDLEDSIAAVDTADKVAAYRNWLGLMKGDLVETVEKGGTTFKRKLNPDRTIAGPDGAGVPLRTRSLMLIRNTGHLMLDESVLDHAGHPVPEGLLDAFVTSAIALHDIKGTGPYRNARHDAIYIVKPKMHGPDEVAFACETFAAVEDVLGLPARTIKIGIMDEERRTSANLKACIAAAKDRVFFINTGFLDRTGDEIHTSMEAGAMVRKADMKQTAWINAYEDWNVDVGLACGLPGHAQIGKGMWAMPDRMADMLREKIGHPKAGANTAWVPSPTAATLHATHYHQVDVRARQRELAGTARATLNDLLTIPLADRPNWSDEELQAELDNNAQGILG